jgi:hypothetical protein
MAELWRDESLVDAVAYDGSNTRRRKLAKTARYRLGVAAITAAKGAIDDDLAITRIQQAHPSNSVIEPIRYAELADWLREFF